MTDADRSPRAVLERAQRRLVESDADGFADLFATGGVLDAPFTPSRRVEGREAVRREMRTRGEAALAAGVRVLSFDSLVVHETADPEVIVAEFREDLVFGDRRREIPFIQVLRVRDGEIVSFRDYVDGLAIAEATSRMPGLRSALTGDGPPG